MTSRSCSPIFLAALCAAALCLASPVFAAKPYSLTIMHTNDVHSRLLPFDKGGRLCLVEGAECAGGMARLAHAVNEVRGEADNTLLLDAGDQFLGTLLFERYKGLAAAEAMTAVGYDAMTLGNHEFDLGAEALAAFLKEVPFPVLAANVDVSASAHLAGKTSAYAVFVRGGRRIGVVGATTPETAFLSVGVGGVRLGPVREAVEESVRELEARGVDIIICLTHQGYAADKELAAQVPGIDVIVGGHSHTVLGAGADAAGPYPTVTLSPQGTPSLVVSNGKWTRSLGVLRVEFDGKGVPVRWSGAPEPLGADAPKAPGMETRMDALGAGLKGFMDSPAGTAAAAVEAERADCRRGECAMGSLVADAMLFALPEAAVDLALINAGAVRAGLPAGDLTQADIATALPFGNSVALVRLTGKEVLAALEHGVSRAAPEQAEMGGTGRFPQVAGMRFAWTPDNAPGSRILAVDVSDGRGGFVPLDPEREYLVAVNDYLAGGGDGYGMIAERSATVYDTSLPLVDAVEARLRAKSPYDPAPDGRIKTMRTK